MNTRQKLLIAITIVMLGGTLFVARPATAVFKTTYPPCPAVGKDGRPLPLPTPVETNPYITDGFGSTNGRTRKQPHRGIDMGRFNLTPIVAPFDGLVTRVTDKKNSGKNGIQIEVACIRVTKTGKQVVMKQTYGHLLERSIQVETGQIIKRGKIVALSDSSATKQPHLHLEVKQGEKFIDPDPKNTLRCKAGKVLKRKGCVNV